MTEKNTEKALFLKLIPVMLAFFAMGFVDLVGIATNYVKKDFTLSDTWANMFPSMVFFWFLVASVPTGMIMNKIGRRKTVIISLAVTLAALLLPTFFYNLPVMVISFCLLGIGNTIMQVSLNPLISNLIKSDKLSSALTFGQFIKAIASFAAPILAAWGALHYGKWQLLFPVFAAEAFIAVLLLYKDNIREEEVSGKASTFYDCFVLLKDPVIVLCFIGIMCHVGIDVGTNVSAPKILMEKIGLTLEQAGYATSVYFLFRTIGCLTGSFILAKISGKAFFLFSVVLMAAAMGMLFFCSDKNALTAGIAMVGFGNSNVFSIIFAQALLHLPEKKNEVSGLMIMGLVGGTVFPLVMGYASDVMFTQNGAVLIMGIGVLYLLYLTAKIKKHTA